MRLTRAVAATVLAAALVALGAAPARAVNDPAFDRQWGMSLIGAPTGWTKATGAGITIAIVDTGVDLDHEDLAGKLVPGVNIVNPGQPPQDDNGHGTHVAGIAAAVTNNGKGVASVAPEAKIMPVKVFGSDGTATENDVVEGVQWAVDHGAKVINMSFGDAGDKLTKQPKQPALGPAFRNAIRYAWNHGAVPVASAGNAGDSYVTSSGFSEERCLVVVAVTKDDAKAGYSSTAGAAVWGGISAPGGSGDNEHFEDNILSTYWNPDDPAPTNYYAYAAGTSMAAPHVSGAVALLLSRGYTQDSAVQQLKDTAKDLGPSGWDATFGWGRIDLAKATAPLSALPTTTTTPPTTRQRTTTTHRTATTAGAVPTTGAPGTTPPTAGTATTGSPPPLEPAGNAEGGLPPIRIAPPTGHPQAATRPWAASGLALVLLLASAAAVVKQVRTRPG